MTLTDAGTFAIFIILFLVSIILYYATGGDKED